MHNILIFLSWTSHVHVKTEQDNANPMPNNLRTWKSKYYKISIPSTLPNWNLTSRRHLTLIYIQQFRNIIPKSDHKLLQKDPYSSVEQPVNAHVMYGSDIMHMFAYLAKPVQNLSFPFYYHMTTFSLTLFHSFLLYSLISILNSSLKKWHIISWNPCMFQLQILHIYVFGCINFFIIDVRFSLIFLCIRNWATLHEGAYRKGWWDHESSLSMMPTFSWQKGTPYTFIYFTRLVLYFFCLASVTPFELWIRLAFYYTEHICRLFVRTMI